MGEQILNTKVSDTRTLTVSGHMLYFCFLAERIVKEEQIRVDVSAFKKLGEVRNFLSLCCCLMQTLLIVKLILKNNSKHEETSSCRDLSRQ